MSDKHDRTRRLERLRSVLAGLPRPRPQAGFRERVHAEFVRAPMPSGGRSHAEGAAAPRWPRLATLAAAAAIVAIAWLLDAGPAWRVLAVQGQGIVRVDGRDVPLTDPAQLARALRPGAVVQLPLGAQLDMQVSRTIRLQLVGGSRVTMPQRLARWSHRSSSMALESGEVRITTGPAFRRRRFEVRTPEARAIVTGTTLAVMRQPDVSCVCVLEGGVTMRTAKASSLVRAESRRSVFRDGSPPLLEPILAMERMKLEMLQDQAAESLRR